MKPLNEINEMVIFGGRLWDERTGFVVFFVMTFIYLFGCQVKMIKCVVGGC